MGLKACEETPACEENFIQLDWYGSSIYNLQKISFYFLLGIFQGNQENIERQSEGHK